MVSSGNKRLTSILLTVVAIAVLAVFTLGQVNEPTGPDSLNNISTSRYSTLGPDQTSAQAGNVSELGITATTPTKAWQGYYGNVSGTISLQDADGSVFYDWSATEPEGEVYASTSNTISWSSIKCFGFQDNVGPNLTNQEANYGMDPNDVDGINETYNLTSHETFYVGTQQLTGCPTTYVYQNSSYQTNNFHNVLLEDNSSLVFTTLLENRDPGNDTDIQGFNGVSYDFQMLVAEDEHNSSSAGPTTYYFWVEIE